MKLPVLSGTEVVKKLKQIGFVATRQKGSHVRLEKSLPQETVKITVPLHYCFLCIKYLNKPGQIMSLTFLLTQHPRIFHCQIQGLYLLSGTEQNPILF